MRVALIKNPRRYASALPAELNYDYTPYGNISTAARHACAVLLTRCEIWRRCVYMVYKNLHAAWSFKLHLGLAMYPVLFMMVLSGVTHLLMLSSKILAMLLCVELFLRPLFLC